MPYEDESAMKLFRGEKGKGWHKHTLNSFYITPP